MKNLYFRLFSCCLLFSALLMAGTVVGQAAQETGTVYLIRIQSTQGSALRTDYTCNGTDIGALKNKSYMPLELKPGKYTFEAAFERFNNTTYTPTPVEVIVKPGDFVFISQRWAEQEGGEYPLSFTVEDKEEGLKLIKSYSESNKKKYEAAAAKTFITPVDVPATASAFDAKPAKTSANTRAGTVKKAAVEVGSASATAAPVSQEAGTVYLIRVQATQGSSLRTEYSCNGTEIGTLYNRTYMPLELKPGKYTFAAQYERFKSTTYVPTPVEVEVKPGETIYISQRWSESERAEYPLSFSIETEEAGKKLLKMYKPTKKQIFEASMAKAFITPEESDNTSTPEVPAKAAVATKTPPVGSPAGEQKKETARSSGTSGGGIAIAPVAAKEEPKKQDRRPSSDSGTRTSASKSPATTGTKTSSAANTTVTANVADAGKKDTATKTETPAVENRLALGTGRIYIVREKASKYGSLQTSYTCNGTDIGELTSNSFMPLLLMPGKYTFTAYYKGLRTNNRPAVLEVEVKAEESVYIVQKLAPAGEESTVALAAETEQAALTLIENADLSKRKKHEGWMAIAFVHPVKVTEPVPAAPAPAKGKQSVSKAAPAKAAEPAKQDKATVYLLRPKEAPQTSDKTFYFCNGVDLGTMTGKSYIQLELNPGLYTFTSFYMQGVKSVMLPPVSIDIKPGETLYLGKRLAGSKAEASIYPVSLALETEADGKRMVSEFTLSKNRKVEASATAALIPTGEQMVLEQQKKLAEAQTPPVPAVNSTPPAPAPKTRGAVASVLIGGTSASAGSGSNTSSTPGAVIGSAAIDPTAASGTIVNLREKAREVLEPHFAFSASNTTVRASQATALKENPVRAEKLSRVAKDFPNLKYRRSSLYTLMVHDESRLHFATIRDAFGNSELSEKYNDHNIGPYLIEGNASAKDQHMYINMFFNRNDIAKKMVAKWFNRSPKGGFNMDLIAARGSYNATDLDVKLARQTARGTTMLADAGEELIKNTFVIINDYKYINKEEVASAASTGLSLIGAFVPGASTATTYAQAGVAVAGKGYVVSTTSYLYQLHWNDSVAAVFYNDYWTEDKSLDAARKAAFENSNIFRLKLIGSQTAWADVQSSIFTDKSEEDLIRMATVKATDAAIAKLQRKFETFQTKTPLYSTNPLAARIGLKEGIEPKDKFEVLEQVIGENGATQYKRVAVLKVDKNRIWDNRFMAAEEPTASGEMPPNSFTIFSGSTAGLYPGMLIRQIK